MTTDSGESSDTMRERATGDTRLLWLLLDADRWLVTALLSGVLFCGILAVGLLHPTPALTLLTRGDPVETLFQALITGTVTAVTLVLTLNQLVLSQELGAVGDQRERMDGSMQFRADVADAVDTPVSPAEPRRSSGRWSAGPPNGPRMLGTPPRRRRSMTTWRRCCRTIWRTC